jgi:hypothetical protein
VVPFYSHHVAQFLIVGADARRRHRIEPGGLQALRDELPGVVGDAMRAVMDELGGKPRK